MEDRRNGESSCNFGDGTDQRAESLMMMMMMMMMMTVVVGARMYIFICVIVRNKAETDHLTLVQR